MKNIVIAIVAILVSIVANAQDSISVKQYKQLETQYLATATVGSMNSSGCFHASIENGQLHIENCNGWVISGGVEASFVSYSNDNGTGSTNEVKGVVSVGYRYNMIRPEVRFAMGSKLNIEDKAYSAPELQVALNCDFNRHSVVNFYVAPTATYKVVNSHKELSNDVVELNIPYEGNMFLVGGKAGIMIKVAKPGHAKSMTVGTKKLNAVKHSQMFVKLEGGYQTGSVSKPAGDKLNVNSISVNASLVYKF